MNRQVPHRKYWTGYLDSIIADPKASETSPQTWHRMKRILADCGGCSDCIFRDINGTSIAEFHCRDRYCDSGSGPTNQCGYCNSILTTREQARTGAPESSTKSCPN